MSIHLEFRSNRELLIEKGLQIMIKVIRLDSIPEDAPIKTEQYYTKASLKLYVGVDFGDKVGPLEVGPSYV